MQMGVRSVVTLYSGDQESARDAAAEAFDEINRLEEIFSDYQPKSELSRLSDQAGTPQMWADGIPVSREMADILWTSRRISEETDGAFDVTVGACVKLWRAARKTGVMATAEELAEARATVGWRAMEVVGVEDGLVPRVRLMRSGTRLDLGGIAKGYAVQRAVNLLKSKGVESCMVALAGDVAVGAAPPGQKGWRVALGSGRTVNAGVVLLVDGAVSTSGDAEQYVEIGGKRYAHIMDPRTGVGAEIMRSGAVIARGEKAGELADSLAKAVYLLGEEEAKLACERFGVAAVLIEGEKVIEVDPSGLLRR